ncbi:MAG: autotransporter assembly complex protein TamA [Ancalomicrobiaceae bacterium]|nr:autotransporter assembly complex protein TamA [Ancalomicrobiaceae bacterium]
MACAATALTPGAAKAFDLFGIHLFGDKTDEPDSPDAQPYTIELEVHSDESAVVEGVRSASRLWSDRDGKPPPSTPAFLAKATGEYAAIVGALRQFGHYGGSITIAVNGKPLESYQPDARLPHPVKVRIVVDAGPAFVFGRIRIDGRPPPLADLRARTETGSPEEAGLRAGALARSDIILKAEETLLAGWRRQGHPKPTARQRLIVADHGTHMLDVTIGADPGPQAVFGEVHVNGTTKMDREYVARQTGIVAGTPWDQDKVEEAKQRLRELQVFSSVVMKADAAPKPDGALDLTTTVAERPLHVYGADASFSTLDGLGLGGFWQHRNLFGHAEQVRLEAQVDGIESKSLQDYSYFTGATLLMPGYFGPDTDLIAKIIGQRQVLDPYSENTIRAQSGVVEHFSRTLTGTLLFNGEIDHASDGFGNRDLMLVSLPASLAYDGSDNKLEPTAGWRATLSLEPVYEAQFGTGNLISKGMISDYVALDAGRRTVLAGRLALGSIVGAPADELPPDRLFFAGGGQSVRGFAYRSLGPVLADGAVVGGRSLFESSLELRMKLTDSIGVVPFVDAGSAYRGSLPDFSGRLNVGAGLGLRYYTGLGAIRLDVALPVNPRPGDARFGLYLGLGESF